MNFISPVNQRMTHLRYSPDISEKTLGIIIPVFNCDPAVLSKLLDRITKVNIGIPVRILIVDDGSFNPPPESIFKNKNTSMLKHSRNMGKGAALKTGFQYFTTTHPVDFVCTIDADLQHPPEALPEFFRLLPKTGESVVVGNRRKDPNVMPLHRIVSNTLTSLLISLLTGKLIRDSQCGYRLMNTSILKKMKLRENRFHLESELLIRAGWLGIPVGFVVIPTIYSNQKSSINNVRDTLNFIALIFKLIWERSRGKCIPR